jgi:hypothetical protein
MTQEWQPTRCHPGQIAGINLFTFGTFIHKNNSVTSAFCPAASTRCEMLYNKDQVVNMGASDE